MNTAMITLSFDDGRKDTYRVFRDILDPMKIPATVNIPPQLILDGYSDPKEIGYNGLMTKNELDWIAHNDLFEISSHGNYHRNDDEDVRNGAMLLQEWYPDLADKIGFASPHSEINYDIYRKKKDIYKKYGILYVRGGRRIYKSDVLKRLSSKIAKITKSTRLFVELYKDSLNNGDDKYLYAVPVMKENSVEQIKGIIDYTIRAKKWLVLELHGIDSRESKEYVEEFCWEFSSFINLCEYLVELRQEEKITIANAADMFS